MMRHPRRRRLLRFYSDQLHGARDLSVWPSVKTCNQASGWVTGLWWPWATNTSLRDIDEHGAGTVLGRDIEGFVDGLRKFLQLPPRKLCLVFFRAGDAERVSWKASHREFEWRPGR